MAKSSKNDEKVDSGRRTFLTVLTALASVAAAALVAIPGFGYFFAALKKPKAEQDWIKLGPLTDFPEQQTLLRVIETHANPLAQP